MLFLRLLFLLLFVLGLLFVVIFGLLGLFFIIFFISVVFVVRFRSLFELFGDVSHCCPVLGVISLLSTHFNKKPSGEYFFIEAVSDEIDGVNPRLEDNFEGSWVVFFNFNQFKVRKGFFNIPFNSVEVAFDQIQGHIFNLVI